MTRETKVGLVVGTGIILLIGIVVSDHLAAQQRGQQQTAAPPGYTDLSNGQPRSISPQGVRPLVDAAGKDRDNRGIAPLPPAGQDDRSNSARSPAIGIAGIDGVIPPANPGTPGTPGTPGPAVTDRNLPGTGNPLPPNLHNDLRNNNFLPEDPTPRLANNGGINPASNNSNNPGNTGNTGVRPTDPLIHHVQQGESLWSIAEKYYGVGNGRYYAEIAKANHEMLLPDGGVRVGVRLVIPNKIITTPGSSVAGITPGGTTPGNNLTPPTPAPSPTDPRANVDPRPALKTVKVEPGDSLSAIASKALGSVKHMQLIIDANKDQIHDADDIKAGMVLRIPELPASAPTPPVAPRTPTTPGTPPPPGTVLAKVHKVQPRDTFTSIARTRLGNERRWKEIFDLNKAQVGSPDALREGIVLVLPSDARP